MKNIKKFLKKIDIFGVPFLFKYKNKEKYRTSLGGLFFIIYCVLVLFIVIYYFIPFINRKNFSTIYYSMNLGKTEQVILQESKAAFAVGLSCDVDDDGTKAEDLLNFMSRFIIFEKDHEGNKNKKKQVLTSHPCTYSDFYNNYNDQVDILELDKLQCLDKIDNIIEGIYTDEVFTYYEFEVTAKEDSEENFEKIYNYLTRNDCYLELYYTDISFDLNNYENPIKPYMNSIYVQLNPLMFIKMNIYFMNQYFYNDNYLVFVYDEQEPVKQILFSRTEEFDFYKGIDRGIEKPNDYETYAKFYIRAETKKTEIKRKYQKVMEFYADASSLLIAILYALMGIFHFINSFYADHSLGKKIFYFKDIKNNNFDAYKKYEQIKKLIDMTEQHSDSIPYYNNPISVETTKRRNMKNCALLSKELENLKSLEKEDINIYNIKQNKKSSFMRKNSELNRPKYQRNGERGKKIQFKNDTNSAVRFNLDHNLIKNRNTYKTRRFDDSTSEEKKIEKLKYYYNILEVINSTLFSCCMSNNLKIKNSLKSNANDYLYTKLDIVLYVRSILLLEKMKDLLLDDNQKEIIEFLIHPKICIKENNENKNHPLIFITENQEKESKKFYSKYNVNDFNKFQKEILFLVGKPYKIKNEKELIYLSNKDLKKLI